ncbi:MAG: FkbM family methyltransferase [Halioglobus sp.]|nr:FkbM family methyltransferase [Halioglobus sp.]
MSNFFPSSYQLKKVLLWPRTVFMRWKYRTTHGPMKAMLELHYYRPALLEFVGLTLYNPHILHEADLDSESIVMDVGAFTGSWAQHMVDRYDPIIYAFEPNPQSFKKLQCKATDNTKLRPLEYGLGDKDEIVEFTLKGLGSSMCDERSAHSDIDRTAVQIVAIDRAWRELDLGHIDLMKINIEGAEFPLLQKMIEAGLLGNVKCFLIQFHEWHPGAYRKHKKIRQELSKTHQLEWDYHFIWEKWVRV